MVYFYKALNIVLDQHIDIECYQFEPDITLNAEENAEKLIKQLNIKKEDLKDVF